MNCKEMNTCISTRAIIWLGYISVPPVTSWISYLIYLLGGSAFWVKLFPAIFGALTIVLVAKIIEAIGGGFYAMLLSCVAVLLSGILRINILFQPNSLDIFSWTLVFYLLVRFFNSNNSKWLYLTALAFAFGFLSKYNILILAAGLAAGLSVTSQRKIFANPHLYLPPLLFFYWLRQTFGGNMKTIFLQLNS
jgi:4-amino-4-deoxy-L-arabinose transferase-like glycosyltransferase